MFTFLVKMLPQEYSLIVHERLKHARLQYAYQEYIIMSATDSVHNRMEGHQRRGHVYWGLIQFIDTVEFIVGFTVESSPGTPGDGQLVGDSAYCRRWRTILSHAVESIFIMTIQYLKELWTCLPRIDLSMIYVTVVISKRSTHLF